MRLVIRELDQSLNPRPGRYTSYPQGKTGYANTVELQHTLWQRNTGPGVENRWIKFVPKGVIIIEFSCNNFGYRDYDFGDYNIKLAQLITLEEET